MSSGYKLYDYNPSEAAAIVFAAIFAVTTLAHIFQMISRRTWYFTPFIIGGLCEFLCLFYQLLSPPFFCCGGMLSNAKSQNTVKLGNCIIVIGLCVQLIFFGFFVVVSVVFHRRINSSPTDASLTTSVLWSRYLKVLYTVSVLIMVRSIYRVIEYVQGTSGVLQEHEYFLYILDATLMLLCCVIMNIFHPSQIIHGGQVYDKVDEDLELLNNRGH
ncbi:uncharacterized protein TRUGW13939_08864 [Talaromyces rugulosus]|uniref:RTA1 domain protein n=1 Tax=Talaromyces rugulosus TaxID=121627 RepID=A0A7H8R5P6_TALRU|nr:uncharacterized protein TRUGW13939_08864 [Talaromyces rugulosus]QKX61709.1 hypothetical protein TRUGW13939_08864 [Talaromyces rugulosus]